MEKVGVRDLKTHASEIVRRLREERETFELTYRGEIVGRIVPVGANPSQVELDQSLREWHDLIEKIDKDRFDDVSAEETMREIRRKL